MKSTKFKAFTAFFIIFLVLVCDQVLKIWIKTNFKIGDNMEIFPWFHLHFVENKGMAFGLQLGGEYGKLALSVFRIVAVFGIGYFLKRLIKDPKTSWGLVASLSFILAGAIGNIIDSTFYGLIFSDSMGKIAQFLPVEGGYASLLHGKVVDMLYFPFYEGFLPESVPFMGGDYFIFFRPVFNIADSAITTGVLFIILFQRSFFAELDKPKETAVLEKTSIEEDNNNNDEGTATKILERPM